MDVRYVNPFLRGAVEVLGTMAGISLEPGKPYIKNRGEAEGDISGLIAINGEAQGSLSVTFHFSLIQAVIRGMLGDEVTEVGTEVRDAVGELTNMISGAARRSLGEDGLSLSAGIPRVIDGPAHKIAHLCRGPVLAIPFSSEYGYMVVEVSLQ